MCAPFTCVPDFLLEGLEWDIGTDYLRDTTEQTLALTHRIWVPPMNYSSLAPFTQLEYEYGPVTVRGGVRHEHAKLDVDDFTTIAPFNTFVRGGELRFDKSVFNIGGIYRIGWGSIRLPVLQPGIRPVRRGSHAALLLQLRIRA